MIKRESVADVALVVVSCDRYSDLWVPFFSLHRKYWPDNPYKTYLIANERDVDFPGVENIKVGPDISYGDNLLKALAIIPERWVILWLDDLFLYDRVDSYAVEGIVNEFRKFGCGYLKMSSDMPYSFSTGGVIGPLPKGIRYRTAIGIGLYERTTLAKLISPGASAWDIDKSRNSDLLPDPIYSLTPSGSKRPPFRYKNVLIRGKVSYRAWLFLRREKLEGIRERRGFESIKSFLYGVAYALMIKGYETLRVYWR